MAGFPIPSSAQVVAVTGSPGPTNQIAVDVVATYPDRSRTKFVGVRPVGFEDDWGFDVIVKVGAKASPMWRADGICFGVAWRPDFTDCPGGVP